LEPRLGYEVVKSEHRRHSARTGEVPADPFTFLYVAIRKRRITARNCERWRKEQGSVINMLITWLAK